MPILASSKSPPAEVQCVREIRAGVPCELIDQLRLFYVRTIGLLPWPERHQLPGGWGLGNPQCGLYLQFRHDPQIDLFRRRFTLTVRSLAAFERRLLDQAWPHQRLRGLGWSDQCILLHDPAGHLIEVRQSRPL